jgi:predicted TIM-barrel fold metal-dependent hydrolase
VEEELENAMKPARRQFMSFAVSALAAASALSSKQKTGTRVREPSGPVVDCHVHLFGAGDGGTGCYLSNKQKKHISYAFFLRLLSLSENGRLDQDYVDRIVHQLRQSSVQRAVLLAQDCRYDSSGKADMENTSFYVPNDYLFQVTNRFPELFTPCVSINPSRRDAIDELERCSAKGSRILKIHPPIQNVDPGEARFRGFYRKCAEKGILVMVHTGTEHSAEIIGNDFSAPERLTTPLEEGCKVIAAHSGMSAFFDKEDFFPQLIELIHRFPNLYCDTAVLADKFRWRCLPRLLAHEDVLERTIYGSDTPFPSNALVFWNRLPPGKLLSLATETNLFERDYRLKQALGLPSHVFERGAKLMGLS